jgi:hypothetical protein
VKPSASIVERAQSAAQSAEVAQRRARERALGVALAFRHTAETLNQSAALAEEHALRHTRRGRREAAEQERRVAARARMAAEQARAYAEQWQSVQG